MKVMKQGLLIFSKTKNSNFLVKFTEQLYDSNKIKINIIYINIQKYLSQVIRFAITIL